MQLAILAHSAPRYDAIGNQVAEKAAFFQERGWRVRVFLHSDANLHPGVAPIALEDRVSESDHASSPTWKFLSQCDFVVVEYSQYFPLLGYLPSLAQKGIRVAVDYHGITPVHLADESLRPILHEGARKRVLIGCADWVMTHSRFMAWELADAIAFPVDRITSSDLPIESIFVPVERTGYLRQRFGISEGRILLFVGRIASNKRPRLLIEALARLKNEPHTHHAVFIGATHDVYASEAEACRELAQRYRVEKQVHFAGQLSLPELAEAFRDADLFVLPSVHEGFCVPIREAMACGLPILAARTSALPETVGNAGLTFSPDDAADLSAQVRRVFETPTQRPRRRRVALACFRFGKGIVGGAERSLRTIGEALQKHGIDVEVFTTCTRHESTWKNEVKLGTTQEGDLLVHRYPIDAHDRERHLKSLDSLRHARIISMELAEEYVRHSVHSGELIDALKGRIDEFDAIIAGPYLFGLTCDIARHFPEKTLLLPCFHEEPLARLPLWPVVYTHVGGILYHTPEEQQFAQASLGINLPNAGVIGTWIQPSPVKDAKTESQTPYLVYCGRYSVEKNVPRLMEFAERYQTMHPGTYDFVFLGTGEVRIPRRVGIRDLGHVSEERKAQVVRDAAALIQLSDKESLSLVVLEAWREGTPVIVSSRSDVMRGHLSRCGGGIAVDTFEEFCDALNRLREQPELQTEMGQAGQAYVRRNYMDEAAFASRILEHVDNLARPVKNLMIEKGLVLSKRSSRAEWRERFSGWIDKVLHEPIREKRIRADIVSPHTELMVRPGQSRIVSLVIRNRGTLPLVDAGPGAVFIEVRSDGQTSRIPLPRSLQPDEQAPVAIALKHPVNVTEDSPTEIRCMLMDGTPISETCLLSMRIVESGHAPSVPLSLPYLEMAQQALAEAHAQQKLPDDYVDVTEGWFRRVKRWLKQKVLSNFRRAYVDVLSRQQSQVNENLVQAVLQLTQHCATLEHAVQTMQHRIDELQAKDEPRASGLIPEGVRRQETQSTVKTTSSRRD